MPNSSSSLNSFSPIAIPDSGKAFNNIKCTAQNRSKGRSSSYKTDIAQYVSNLQITRINFDQYLQIHKQPDTYSTQRDATTQTEHTTIKPKHLLRNLSNRMRSEIEKQNLDSYWPSDNNDDTDEEFQKHPPETFLDDNSPNKTYTHVSF